MLTIVVSWGWSPGPGGPGQRQGRGRLGGHRARKEKGGSSSVTEEAECAPRARSELASGLSGGRGNSKTMWEGFAEDL